MADILFGEFCPSRSVSNDEVQCILTHLHSASNDILRIYDLAQPETLRHRSVPFTIIPGHRGGTISSVYIDHACKYMLSAAGNRGWDGGVGTEALLGYEIAIQDPAGVWHK